MRRAVAVVAATGGGLALLANFHTSPAPSGVAESGPGPSTVTEPASSSTTTTGASTTSSLHASTTTTAPTTTPLPTVDGPVAVNEWGEVQVRVTFSGSHIVDVRALRLPHDNSHSAALSREAQPILRNEALQAQSANIDLVSGATLTSRGYIESLQGALDRAGR